MFGFRTRTSNVGKGLAKATRGDVVIFRAICGSIWTARDPLFKATREDVVIFGAICGNIRTARDPLFRLLGV